MKLGIVQNSLGKCSLVETFSRASQCGADGLELRYATTGQLEELHKKQNPLVQKRFFPARGCGVRSLSFNCWPQTPPPQGKTLN